MTRTSQDTSWVPSEIDILDTNELPTLDGEQTDREDIVDGSSYEYGDDGGDDDTFIPDNSWDQRRQR